MAVPGPSASSHGARDRAPHSGVLALPARPRVDARDAALIERAGRGDIEAFAEIYDRHADAVFALLRRILQHASDAQDLLHDVFIESWQSAREYDPSRASVRGWLVVRARARAIDRLRRLQRERSVRLLTVEREPLAEVPPEHQLALRQALSTLEPSLREALELTYFEGLTAAEVSRRVHSPEGTVRSRLARGLASLQEILRDRT